MSARNELSFDEAMAQMAQALELELVEMSAKNTIELAKVIAEEVRIDYDDFFGVLLAKVLRKLDDAPRFLEKYIPDGEWHDVSLKWHNRKVNTIGMPVGSNWYYNGISKAMTMGNRLSRKTARGMKGQEATRLDGRTRRQSGKVRVPAFTDYIATLQQSGTTAKFFGPVTLQYDFQAPKVGHVITAKMGQIEANGTDTRNLIKKIYVKDMLAKRQPFAKFPENLRVTARVEAFGALAGVQQTEWFIVDYILKRIDPANEKQWVKINGRGKGGRGGRPIRPIILPMVQYYIQNSLPAAIRAAY